MKAVFAVVSSVLVGLTAVAEANTWHVDDDWYGKGGDGSEAAPFGTIQDAIDANTTVAGDLILVHPGVYTNGVSTSGVYPCRVYVSKGVTIRSTEGRANTQVLGVRDPTGANGIGPKAVACFIVAANNSVIDGFTIANGCTTNNNSSTFMGGGVLGGNAGGTRHLIDCTVRDCSGRNGVVSYMTVHRCWIGPGNYGKSNCSGLYGAPAENTIIVANPNNASHYMNMVNCTIVGNGGGCSYSGDTPPLTVTYNSIYALNGSDYDCSTSNCRFTNSVSTASASKFGSHGGSVFDVPGTNLFVAPLFNDFRLRSGSAAIGLADPKWLTKIPLPAGYIYRDYLGQAIDTNAPAINAGAIQATVDVKSGCYQCGDDVAKVDGVARPNTRLTYAYATAWPTQWCVTAVSPDTAPLSCIYDSLLGRRRFSGYDGTIWVTPPPVGTNKTVTAECAQVFRYVDPNNGSDSNDGKQATKDPGSNAGPWETLQYAYTKCYFSPGKRTMIFCAPGVYNKGFYKGGGAFSNRVSILSDSSGYKLHFIATEGPEKTFIVGSSHDPSQPDTAENNYGLGANALRCVFNNNVYTGFRGFTLTGGHSAYQAAEYYPNAGGSYYGDNVCAFTDCIISNNVAYENVVHGNSSYERCVFTKNRLVGGGGVFFACFLSGCRIYDNYRPEYYSLLSDNVSLLHCSVVKGGTSKHRLTTKTTLTAVNSIFSDFEDGFSNQSSIKELSGCLFDNTTTTIPGVSVASGDPIYFDKSKGDLSLMRGSAAVGVTTTDSLLYGMLAGTDFAGNPICRTGVAPLAAGSDLTIVTNVIAVRAAQGGIKVLGQASSLGNYILSPGESLTITADVATAMRPISAVLVNGVTNVNAYASGWSLTLSYNDVVSAGGIGVQPIYSNGWYVNANTDPANGVVGSDANSGFSPDEPRLTLASALGDARLTSGDVVTAAPGVYSNGTMNTLANLTAARVEIKSGVTLRASGSAADTIIMGAAATEDFDENGLGTNAVRCVYMESNARLEGFTLSGGYSQRVNVSPDRHYGCAAVCGSSLDASTASLVTGCVITNCHNYRGITYNCVMVNCRMVDCWAYQCALLYGVNSYGCYFSGNHMLWDGFHSCPTTENCTWAGDNKKYPGTSSFLGYDVFNPNYKARDIRNSLIIGRIGYTQYNRLYNCVMVTNQDFADIVFKTNSYQMSVADMKLDADYRPIPGVSPITELGDASIATARYLGETDLSGVPRILNGAMDPGALEADWRTRYAEDIGRKITVDWATSNVVETADRTVKIQNNDSLSLTWAGGRDGVTHARTVRFFVTGDGTLTLTRNGVEEAVFTASATEQVYEFKTVGPEPQKLVFTYAGDADGFAEILNATAKSLSGFVLIVK